MDVVTSFPAYFMDVVHGLCVAPAYFYVAVIALFFGVVTSRVGGVFFVPVVAAVVYIAAQQVIPALLHHTEILVPAFNLALVQKLVALYIVFLVVDTIVFGIKKAILAVLG
jgi:hypothetical protein